MMGQFWHDYTHWCADLEATQEYPSDTELKSEVSKKKKSEVSWGQDGGVEGTALILSQHTKISTKLPEQSSVEKTGTYQKRSTAEEHNEELQWDGQKGGLEI